MIERKIDEEWERKEIKRISEMDREGIKEKDEGGAGRGGVRIEKMDCVT